MGKMRDYEIRKYLHKEVLQDFHNDKDSVVVDELGILWGQSRIDIAIINGSIHAYEIKSSVDTLDRLPRQLDAYRKVCDYITLAVSSEKYNKMSSDEKYSDQTWLNGRHKIKAQKNIVLDTVRVASKESTCERNSFSYKREKKLERYFKEYSCPPELRRALNAYSPGHKLLSPNSVSTLSLDNISFAFACDRGI